MSRHVVLAGDSIFDNDAYVPGEPGVLAQLRAAVPPGWSCSKIAVDGDCTVHVRAQLARISSGATDLVVSVGGNDALKSAHLLSLIKKPQDLTRYLREPLAEFEAAYRDMLSRLMETGLRLNLCTIYTQVPFEDANWRKWVPSAVAKFNEIILRQAAQHAIGVIRIDQVCTEVSDYSAMSPIEPSAQGGQKIVDLIVTQLEATAQST